ncbi:MAG: tubulin-like doman-containing protein [Halobacteriota archaeon]|uniref:tubulin-like doman-containing protein n=1 Tax=Natronomonas sp. TaxID=2184060 RepID=UPI0039766256
MTNPLPTFVVGVGRGGIEIMRTLADIVERDDHSRYFDFVAIDTDTDSFSDIPDDATTIELNAPTAFEAEDRRQYAYLTEEMEIGVKGAERQRPVGRYKLDSRGTPDFSDHFDLLWKSAREHLQGLENSYEPSRDSYNLILVHSLGGGTGSGTFPLLGTMLGHIGDAIEQRYGMDVYVGGVGIVPQITQDPEIVQPKGQSIYYPNAHASLQDLSKMIEASSDHLDIPLYSRSFGRGGQRPDIDESVEASFSGNSLPIERTPFSNYWLVGVEEDLIMGGGGFSDIENYGEMVDRRVAESIHALALMEESVENWATAVNGLATLGAVGQSEIRLPYREIRDYCELKRDRDAKQTRLEAEIPEEIQTLEAEINQLESAKTDPKRVASGRSDVDDAEDLVRGKLEQKLGVGSALVDGNTAEDIRSTVSTIGETYGPTMMLLAVDKLDEMFDHPAAVPAVESHWEEVVDQHWEGWNMNSKSEFGGSDVRTYRGKEGALERYFDQTISEYEKEVEARDPGMLDKIPAFISLTESTREEYQRWLDNLRNSQQQLLEVDNRYQRVQAMVEAADDLHREAKEALDERIADRQESITALEEETRQLEREIKRHGREIDELSSQLTKRDRAGQRLSILPLQEGTLEELTLDRLRNELTSLDKFVGEFVDEDDLRIGMDKIQSNALAWEYPTVEMNYDGLDPNPSRQDLWIMYHENNEKYADEYVSKVSGATVRKAGQSIIGYSDDPYSIQFVSFDNSGPVEGLQLFQRYEQMRESGMLDSMAGKFGDHRASYAYPEWYSREDQKIFQISRRQTTDRPPELDPDRVVKSDFESEGEKRNYIKTNGLDLYIWHGTMWEHFDFQDDNEVFLGWEQAVDGLTFKQLQQATPDENLKARWLAGQAEWDDILDAYIRNLEDRERLELSFETEE